jgi:transcription antitermination factor NusG
MNAAQPWFALQTRPRNEKKVDYLLKQKGYEAFTPTYRQRRRWSDRTTEIELPLFPRYTFCRLNPGALGKIVSIPGVNRIVGFGGKHAEVAPEEIEAFRVLARSNCLREPWKYLPDGTLVLIKTGPLAGIQGIVRHDGDCRRLIISITLLQQSVAIQLDDATVVSVISRFNAEQPELSAESDLALRVLMHG